MDITRIASFHLAVICLALVMAQAVQGQVTIKDPQGDTRIATIDDFVTFTCECSDGDEVEWVFDHPIMGEIIIENKPPFVITNAETREAFTSLLTIEGATGDDQGVYTCRSVGDDPHSDSITLVVSEDAPPSEWVAPAFERRSGQTYIEVEAGKELRLKCTGGSDISHLIILQNGDQITQDTHNLVTSSQNVNTNQIEIILSREPAEASFAGIYTCHDEHFPDVEDAIEVKVIDHPSTRVEIIEPASSATKAIIGENFHLKCQADIHTTIVWFHEEMQLETEVNGYIIGEYDDTDKHIRTSVLTKEDTVADDGGNYHCRNADSAPDEATVHVDVKQEEKEPIIGAVPTERRLVIMKVGATVNLECSFEAPGEFRPEWTKDGRIICAGPKYRITMDTQTSSLVIKNSDSRDAGIYQCVFQRRHRHHIAGIIIFNVTALPCPPITPPDYGSYDVCPRHPLHGDSCTFQCHSEYSLSSRKPLVCEQIGGSTYWEGHKPKCKRIPWDQLKADMPLSWSHVLLQIGSDLRLRCTSHQATWSKDGHQIHGGEKYHIRNGHLVIRNPNKLDAGVYDCLVRERTTNHLTGIQKFNVTTLPCPRLYAPKNGSIVQCSNRPVYGEQCIFRCKPGQKLTGNRARTCVLSHSNTQVYWTGGDPVCTGPYSAKLPFTSTASTMKGLSLYLETLVVIFITALLH